MAKREKPKGRSGYFRVSASADAAPIEHSLPNDKEGIERRIVEMFIRSHAPDAKPVFNNPKQNKENHFDFSVITKRGDAFLELMEIAPLSLSEGSYEKAPAGYKAGERAAVISKSVFKKSKRYKTKCELFLLLYLTDWKFALGTAAIQILRYNFKKQPHTFSAIFYMAPLDERSGVVHWLYPVPPSLLFNFRPEEHEDAFTLNLDYQKFQLSRGALLPPDPL